MSAPVSASATQDFLLRFRSNAAWRAILINIACLIFAAFYQMPNWPELFEQISGHPMVDRSVYERMLLEQDLPTDRLQDFTIVQLFSLEWLWNAGLSVATRYVGATPDEVFTIISLIFLWRFAVETAYRAGLISILLLINPLVVDLAFSQLRLALALAIMCLCYRGQFGRIGTVVGYTLCASIHTAIVLFAAMHFAASRPHNKLSWGWAVLLVALGVSVSLATGPFRDEILQVVGDRRIDYHDMSSSLMYLSFWFLMWAFLVLKYPETLSASDSRYALIVLSVVVANIFTGGYSTRFIAASFPWLISTMCSWPSKPQGMMALVFIPYAIFQWAYWFNV